jgi:hypothetical protein
MSMLQSMSPPMPTSASATRIEVQASDVAALGEAMSRVAADLR